MTESKPIPHPTFWMIAAACISYSGYEFARAASTSLLISELGAAAMPPALICVAITAYIFVFTYRIHLTKNGARSALYLSAIGIAIFFLFSSLLLTLNPNATPTRKVVVFFVFVVRQAYVTFLSSQQFSFIVSLLESNQNSLGPIYGCSSLASAFAAAGASMVISPVLSLFIASMTLFISAFVADVAYKTAFADINLSHRLQRNTTTKKNTTKKNTTQAISSSSPSSSSSIKSTSSPSPSPGGSSYFNLPSIFTEHPQLFTLFVTTFIMQMIGAIINLSYSELLETELPTAAARNSFVGRFYFIANFVSCIIQFLGLKYLVQYVGLHLLMIVQPALIVTMICMATMKTSIWTVALTMLTMKTIEYSIFSAVKDLTYLPLSFEARFLAKEYTDVFAYRAGKMFCAVLLTLIGLVAHQLESKELLSLSIFLGGIWLYIAFSSRNQVVTNHRIEPVKQ